MKLTEVEKKPVSFVVPTVAAAGAVAGLLVGTANNAPLMGVVIGAVLLGALAWLLMTFMHEKEKTGRWGVLA